MIASEYPLFLGHISDAEFAAILQAPPPVENLPYIEIESEPMAEKTSNRKTVKSQGMSETRRLRARLLTLVLRFLVGRKGFHRE
jgi:hypothetical protein